MAHSLDTSTLPNEPGSKPKRQRQHHALSSSLHPFPFTYKSCACFSPMLNTRHAPLGTCVLWQSHKQQVKAIQPSTQRSHCTNCNKRLERTNRARAQPNHSLQGHARLRDGMLALLATAWPGAGSIHAMDRLLVWLARVPTISAAEDTVSFSPQTVDTTPTVSAPVKRSPNSLGPCSRRGA